MAYLADRVQETTTSTSTGAVTLGGAVSSYRTFSSAFTSGDSVRYAIAGGSEWEVGEGVYTSGSNQLSRVTVFASSNSGSLVNFSAGTKTVWCDLPAAMLSGVPGASNGAVLYRDSNGHIAGSSSLILTDSPGSLQISADNNSTVVRLINYAPSANGANIVVQKARGSLASPTKTLSGDQLGGFGGRGYFEDGTPGFGPATVPSLRFLADEDFTSTTNGVYCAITCTRKGTTSTAEVFRVTGHGWVTVTGRVASTGSIPLFQLTGAAHTSQTASTELNEVLFDLSATLQFAAGAIATQRMFLVKARTYSFASSSTITTAATFVIDKAPQAGTNCTITNAYSLWIQAGLAKFDGGISTTGLTNTGSTFLIYNPAGTFKYTLTTAAIAADRVLNYPLLAADDTLVAQAHTQTLTNKTLDGATISGSTSITSTTVVETPDAHKNFKRLHTAAVTTTDATPTQYLSFATTSGRTYRVRGDIGGMNSTASAYSSHTVNAYFTNNAGTLTQREPSPVTTGPESNAGTDVTCTASGTNIVITVTGIAASTRVWSGRVTIEEYIP